MSPALEVRFHRSVRELSAEEWDACAGPVAPPFVRWAFLEALEAAGCVHPERGWAPVPLSVRQGGRVLAVVPAYLKGNSEGEFVFDHAWARFAESQLDVRYYPKLVVAAPFTPATGPRVLCRAEVLAEPAQRDAVFAHVSAALTEFVLENSFSSAHVLFPAKSEVPAWLPHGWIERHGLQFQWANAGYSSFEDFLGTFNAKRRAQIRRERREVAAQGIRIDVLSGHDLGEAELDLIYRFYLATVDKFVWGRRYLNRRFFGLLRERMPDALHVVFAREGTRTLAGAFNLLGPEALYGRYWGALEERRFLHFEVCYYAGVEEAIRRGLQRFEPGAGGEHKEPRGFSPTVTHSVHHLRHPVLRGAVEDFCRRERHAIAEHVAAAEAGAACRGERAVG
jgi:predicted N-acyltransferase